MQFYRRIGLNDREAMLVLHLHTYLSVERNDFPTPEQLQERMGLSADEVLGILQKLVTEGYIAMEEGYNPVTNMHFDRYELAPIWERIAKLWTQDLFAVEAEEAGAVREAAAASQTGQAVHAGTTPRPNAEPRPADLFTMFEREFARPLSPMECETIVKWIDLDKYGEPLITAALQEAVFAGKLRFNYIDRILLEWSRNQVRTPEQAKSYTQRFRGR